MALLQIPIDNENPAFSFFAELDSVVYQFIFRYNSRIENWVFDMFDENQDPVQTGNPLLSGFPAMSQNRNLNKYPGVLIALNATLQGLNATRFTLGVDVLLFYNEADDA